MGASPHLLRAYELATSHNPHPNPRVGAVVVSSGGEVLGEGAHVEAGQPHAEVNALEAAGDARGATLYVSLEPCAHQGRTPPCVERIIAAGVRRVVVGTTDPDSRVAGSGIARLRADGVIVEEANDPAAEALDPGYFHQRRTGLPLVTLKYAMTLDGAIAADDGSSRWITSSPARADAHRLRSESDAVVIGAGTLAADNPRLDVRLDGYEGHQPRPVVVAGRGSLPTDARIWDRDPLVLATSGLETPSGDVVVVSGEGRPDPRGAANTLAELGYLTVLLEGGAQLSGSWWEAGVVKRGVVYVGSIMGGGRGMSPLATTFSTIDQAREVTVTSVRKIGGDVRVDFEVGV